MQLIQLAADVTNTTAATIPQPPVDDEMPKTAETIFNIFIFLPLLAMIGFAIREIKKNKNPVLLYCLIGGAFAATMEPVVDVLGLVYLKEADALGTFTILDRTMPLYICFVYPWYVGGLGYMAYRLFQNGITRKGLFQLWALDCIVDIALETPGIVTGTYLYYGEQPLNPWGFPIWWGFVNPVMPMVAGALIYHVRPHLKSKWQLLGDHPADPDGRRSGQRRRRLADVDHAESAGRLDVGHLHRLRRHPRSRAVRGLDHLPGRSQAGDRQRGVDHRPAQGPRAAVGEGGCRRPDRRVSRPGGRPRPGEQVAEWPSRPSRPRAT